MTRAAGWAWALVVACAALAVADTVMVSVSTGLFTEDAFGFHGWPLVNLASLGATALGALIVVSYPRHPVGWLLAVVGTTSSVSLVAESYSIWVLEYDGPGTEQAGQIGAMIAAILGGPLALGVLAVVFVLVPDGQLPSRRWRWVIWVAALGELLFLIAVVLLGPEGSTAEGQAANRDLATDIFLSAGVLLIAVTVMGGVWALARRLHRSEGVVRQQLRVVAFGAWSVGGALLFIIVGQAVIGKEPWWGSIPLFAAYLALTTSIAVAVLRYRLSDVDVIISSTLVVAVASVFAGLGYVVVVVVASMFVGSRDIGFWPSLAATALVAVAFQPLRRWVVRFANRLAYGDRAVPYEALADFSRRLGERPEPTLLLPALAEAAAHATASPRVEVCLTTRGVDGPAAVWPPEQEAASPQTDTLAADTPDAEVHVAIDAEAVGMIRVYQRPGRTVRAQDLRLLHDLAGQAGRGFRNAQLEAELAAHVAELDEHAAELAESRRRVIEAADDGRRSLEGQISREVVPPLEVVKAELAAMGGEPVDADVVTGLIDQATTALETLRELTRGIYPTQLTRSGLGPALAAYFGRLDLTGAITIDPSLANQRFATRVESAAYFCCTQAVGGSLAAEQADIRARLSLESGWLVIDLDGVAVPPAERLAMVDRAEVCGGTIDFDQVGQAGPRVALRFPAADPDPGSDSGA